MSRERHENPDLPASGSRFLFQYPELESRRVRLECRNPDLTLTLDTRPRARIGDVQLRACVIAIA